VSNVTVKYQIVEESRIKDYLLELLAKEWDPKGEDYSNIKKVKWSVQSLSLDEITLDQELLIDPDFQKDVPRRVEFHRNKILHNEPIMPLVIMYKDKYLVDGYARFFALKKLGIKEAKVYLGLF